MNLFNQHGMKELAILLFLTFMNSTSLDAQCMINYPTTDTIDCAVPIDSFPRIMDSDISGCMLTSIDSVGIPIYDQLGCDDDPVIYAKFYRRWNIVSDFGSQVFLDTICVAKIDTADVEFPMDTTLDCSADTTISGTGYPTANDNPILGSFPHCNLWVGVTTTIENLSCAGGRYKIKIHRDWTIMNICNTMETLEHRQTIHVIDTTDPEMTLPIEIKENTESTKCAADFTLPVPLALSDNCTDSSDIQLFITVYPLGGGPAVAVADADRNVTDIPIGQFIAEYIAADGCGNNFRDTMDILVEDCVPPVVTGKDKVLQFNAGVGMLTLPAESFDHGTVDNCGPISFKVKRMTAPVGYDCFNDGNSEYKFDDAIKFCCQDAAEPVMVILRAYDKMVPPGPVDDDLLESKSSDYMLMVTVLDKSDPSINCLDNDTIDCSEDLIDLSRLGVPTVEDNCDATVVLDTTIYDLNDCGLGCITRRFVAMDPSGNTDTCNHKVIVTSDEPFNAYDTSFLKWPEDVILMECSASTDTSNTGAPELTDKASCAQIIIGYDDEIFQYAESACLKIFRKWRVYDWCQFDNSSQSQNGSYPGVWYYTQVIKVDDTLSPELLLPSDVCFGSQSLDCSDEMVTVPNFLASDCTPESDIRYSFEIDFGKDGSIDRSGIGNDVSGEFPQGCHRVIAIADDGCGNRSVDTFQVEVKDAKPPTPVLDGNLVTELMDMGGGNGMVDVHAGLFAKKSFDNCTASQALRFAFSTDPDDTLRTFTCDDIGDNPVDIYVFDESGNFDFLKTSVEIQDNMEVCSPTTLQAESNTEVYGSIQTELGKPIERVSIKLMKGNVETPTTTDRKGEYMFSGVEMHQDYLVEPEKDINPLNGISTLDIVKMTKHLLGSEVFESPYQIIASDINRNGSVTTLDIVHLRKLILGIIPGFRDDKSWEFVDANYKFVDPQNPLDEAYPTVYDIKDLSEDMTIDFIGIKLGDVDHSVRPNRLSTGTVRNNSIPITLWYQEVPTEKGKRIDIKLKDLNGFDGIQFAMKLSESSSIELGKLSENEVYFDKDNQELRVSHHRDQSAAFEEERLLSIYFDVQEIPGIDLSEDYLHAEGYLNSTAYPIVLKSIEILDSDSGPNFEVSQNNPNPFNGQTSIDLNNAQSQKFSFSVYDLSGKTIHSRELYLDEGSHQIIIEAAHIPESGIYIYEFKNDEHTIRNKMIKIK